MVALCVLTGRDWLDAAARPARRPGTSAGAAAVTLGLVYAQIVAGAWLRHFGDGRRPGRHIACWRRPSGATRRRWSAGSSGEGRGPGAGRLGPGAGGGC